DYIVITVFAADCAPCIREAKDLDAAVAAWQKRHIALIGISADITRDRVQKFVSQTGLPQNYPMYIAPWFVEDRHVDGTPALFLFDPAAKLLGHWSVDDTPDPFHALQAKLDDLQAGSPLVTPGAEHDPALIVQTWAAAQEDAVAKQLPALAQAFDTLAADQPTGALDETIRLRLSNEALQAFKQPHVVRAFAMKFWRAGTTPQRLTFQWPAPAAKAPGATGWNMGSATDGTNAPAAPTPPPGAVNVTRPGDTADSLRRMLPQGGGDHWNAILQPMYRTADHQALMQVNLDPAAAPSLRVVLWLELPPPPPEVLNALPNAHP
ncbi:MAG: peroxiredoxin family protein, partial [Planctomycetota bacterium]